MQGPPKLPKPANPATSPAATTAITGALGTPLFGAAASVSNTPALTQRRSLIGGAA